MNEDANIALPDFCQSMGDFDRAVVFLDPYATEVSWSTVATIAETGKIDCWILFPLSAIARMMPRQNEPNEQLSAHLNRVFGGQEFWQDFYRPSVQQLLPLFGDDTLLERTGGSALIAEQYKRRLQTVFHSVAPNSKTLRNSKGSPLFEFYFAASNPVGAPTAIRIANHLLENW
ncbi:MAG: three-Cys-motif partner protein TcmP [Chloroflexota bacterium]|nr:three-Cys-motif partner protein TcmP [Chloroflexota bacterium]